MRLKIPWLERRRWRREVAAYHAEERARRRQWSQHNSARMRIMAEAPRVPDPWRECR